MRAFFFLAWTSARNRFLSQITRARSPRYVIALLAGGVYLWFFLFRPTGRGGATSLLLGQRTEAIATLFTLFSVLGTWALGGDRTALAYSQAEVAFLFPAPLTRRALVLFKLYRAQIVVLINTLIWVFLFRRGGTVLPSAYRAIALWAMFSTLNLHRLGAAMVRASWVEHRAAGIGLRRNWAATLAFVVLLAVVAITVVSARANITANQGPGPLMSSIAAVMSVPPASIVLYPFHLIIAPTFAVSVPAWWRLIWPALLVLAFHFVWVIRANTVFEEAAVEASAEQARRSAVRRARGGAFRIPTSQPTRSLPLGPVGHPAFGIVWKNTLCLLRTVELRLFMAPVVAAIAFGLALEGGAPDAGRVVASCGLSIVAALLLFGGRIVRNDLRQDMLNLPMLKTLPLTPRHLVMAEVGSSAIPMAAIQLILVVTAFVAVSLSPATQGEFVLSRPMESGVVIAAPFALFALNMAIFTIENARAVLFPAWTPLGARVGGRVEALGQNVLAMIAAFAVLGVALMVPVGVGGLVFRAIASPTLAMTAAILAGTALLGAENYFAFFGLGSALRRSQPSETM